MDRIEEMPINRLLTEMAMKTFPSPKAGSSLALTLAMACALLELVIADRGEERAVPPGRDWHSDVLHVREWRRDALLLGEADMSEVIRLFRDHPGTAEANPLSSPTPVARLQALAETVMETGIPYLDHAGDKKSDVVTVLLQARAVWLGAHHIRCYNRNKTMEAPLTKSVRLTKVRLWDERLEMAMQTIEMTSKDT
ncbi:hypothetical protein JIR001_06630 [Polycladomyces abyssicola]|uniref:Uncharacterized protein n=1 Tax=Polycladomyces abyssicola TaxID=1125966 RepID=A0A8D5ZLR9_9BACL|nr:hypothetical protein [Polycladomyces abyssicola]BCU80880.1 hypothetical protein JIR001_06630 [Polycladomyces abyssicola]